MNVKKNKTILITGGCGFIGSAVVKNIINDNHFGDYHIIIVDNLIVGSLDNLPLIQNRIEFHQVDIRVKEDLEPLIARADYVIHLAANVSIQISVNDPIFSSSVNISGFLNILELCRQYQIKSLVYASSAAVYGNCEDLLSENKSLNPISPYGLEKMANEYYARFYFENYGLKSVGLRYFNVYGPGNNKSSDYSGVIKIFIDKARSSEAINIYGDGSQSRDFIFVADVAKYTIKMLFSDISGVFNLATGNSITIIELAKTIAHIAGVELPINFLPKKPTDIIQSQASVEKIKAAIPDFSTVNILEGLTQTINK